MLIRSVRDFLFRRTPARSLRSLATLMAAAATFTAACDPQPQATIDPGERAAFAAAGLEVETATRLAYDDGSVATRGSEPELALRTTEGRRVVRESAVVIAREASPEPWSAAADEIVLFANEAEGLALRARHGVAIPSGTIASPTRLSAGGADWLQPEGTGGALVVAGTSTRDGDAGGTLVTSPGGTLGGPGSGPGEVTGGGPDLPVRYAMADGLALRALPSFASAELMELAQGDRVFVLANLPVPVAGGQVFVRVQVADRAPYPTGWFPLPWLIQTPPAASSDTLALNASFGLLGRLARDFVAEAFWRGCDQYPLFPHDAVFFAPPSVVDLSIPYAQRYSCGELPVGTIENGTWKHITTVEHDTDEFRYPKDDETPMISIDSIHFEIPIKLYRTQHQTRGDDYEVKDLSTGFYQLGSGPSADVVEHSRYARIPGELQEPWVRLHDTDFWYNVTFAPPAGVEDIGATAYLNACVYLPGFRLRGAPVPMDITIEGGLQTSHITGIDWGAYDVSPFRLCTTAGISTEPGDPQGDLVAGPQAPLRLRMLRATLHGVSIHTVEGVAVHGTLKGIHGAAINAIVGLANEVLHTEGALGLVFEEFARTALEARMLEWLNQMGATLAQGLPDPGQHVADACDLLPAAYASPTHPFFPLYQICVDAANAAAVEIATNATGTPDACHADPSAYARANDVTSFTSPEDVDDVYYVEDPAGGQPDAVLVQRPWWNGCGLESAVDTVAPAAFWPLLECAAETMDVAVNYQMSATTAANRMQGDCLVPAVGMMCEWYGEGADLMALWTPNGVPAPGSTFGFCDWYDSLTAPDLPDLAIE